MLVVAAAVVVVLLAAGFGRARIDDGQPEELES
jgi:hypothetical protein